VAGVGQAAYRGLDARFLIEHDGGCCLGHGAVDENVGNRDRRKNVEKSSPSTLFSETRRATSPGLSGRIASITTLSPSCAARSSMPSITAA
jgi:hypothetical protein